MLLGIVPVGGTLLFLVYGLMINVVTFFVYGADKKKAREKKWRTPESVLILLAVIGGSIGALLGMKVFRHKTKHVKFFIGVPLILIIQIILFFALYFMH